MPEKKKFVSYMMLMLGVQALVISVVGHLTGHGLVVIEVLRALFLLSTGVALYTTDAHKIVVSTARVMRKYLEVSVMDQVNYSIADLITSFCQHFRKTHTGLLSHNMLAVLVGIALLIIIFFFFGGYPP